MFDLDLSEELDALKEHLKCKACNENYNDPVTLKACGHTFCNDCIQDAVQCVICDVRINNRKDKLLNNSLLKDLTAKLQLIEGYFEEAGKTDYKLTNVSFNASGGIENEVRNTVLCEEIHEKPIKLLSDALQLRNAKGETVLHRICKRGDAEQLKDILKQNYDVNAADFANWTPLHEAIQQNSLECVTELLEAGALPNAVGAGYLTPLHKAIALDRPAIVELLLKYGADLSQKTNKGLVARDLSCSETVQHLLHTVESTEFKERYFYNFNKEYYGHKINAANQRKMSANGYHMGNYKSNISLLILNEKEENLHSKYVLIALLKGIMIINETQIDEFLHTATHLNLNLIHPSIKTTFIASLKNKLQCKPKLFHGMHFFVMKAKCFRINDVNYSRDDLIELILAGGGQHLVRAPSESTTHNYELMPYHSPVAYKRCAHFIVYDAQNPPKLQYKMPEMRHVSSEWLIECISLYKIKHYF